LGRFARRASLTNLAPTMQIIKTPTKAESIAPPGAGAVTTLVRAPLRMSRRSSNVYNSAQLSCAHVEPDQLHGTLPRLADGMMVHRNSGVAQADRDPSDYRWAGRSSIEKGCGPLVDFGLPRRIGRITSSARACNILPVGRLRLTIFHTTRGTFAKKVA
jgi:hypothetical protein